MAMPQDPAMMPPGPPPGPGGGDPISHLLQLATQAADAINQLGQALSDMQQPAPQMGPPPGPPQPGAGGPPQSGSPEEMALVQAMQQRMGR